MNTNPVSVDVDGAVAHVRLNKPQKLNALDHKMFRGLVEAGRTLIADESVRAVVLAGAGRAFCAGLDFTQFAQMSQSPGAGAEVIVVGDTRLGGARALGQQAVRVWSELQVPVIAAIHGVAFGGGLQIALGADIRIVAPTAELSVMEISWGLIPDMAGTQLLPELVGRDVAKELTFTGRKVSGEDAVRLGLATRASTDPIAAATELAREIAQHDRNALREAKKLLDMAGRVELVVGLDAEQVSVAGLLDDPEFAAGVKARLDRVRSGRGS
ncbi:crotonase/enoyl-CoA hydratase family protein [[Mycobacterium] burgundiense]|uniref:Crotonase/enoyl-CoA hydratase family protein n=1 Tax=[Mycobacterium] burgundiense TaxID=3064286 RepID=A0ABM9LHU1_9MYCO|nr:crotonase/enoyl-CoA hydratase family protein [Mycolicibacterium sp. MU0053]CAJ1499274.1 crotonase/enoyl-CoA hydratase family protein [Mycolicibacterium sp. MU0053]